MKRTSIKKGFFACIAALLTVVSTFAQTITTGAVSPAAVCAGSTVSVEFTTTGTFDAGNTFKIELSDAAGSFPGTVLTSTGAASPLTATIPETTAAGATYKVRVIADNPAVSGSPSPAFTVNVISAAPAVANVSYTVGDKAAALTATGTGLLWYTAATGGTGSATAPTPSTSTAGTTSYYVSQTIDCESPRAKIDVIVTVACVPPAAPAVANISYKVGDKATALTATGTGLLWYSAATGGTGSATAPTPSTATAGTTSYWVSQTVDCESPRAKIDVIVSAACVPPAAPAVANVNYTVGDKAAALTATGTGLLWYSAATGGTGSSTAPTPSTATSGTTSYWVSQTVDCESPRAKIDVIVSAACVPPAAPAVVNVNYTVGDKAAALTATGTGLLWYSAATGGTGSATAPPPSTATAGTTSYYVSQTVGCESARSRIVVTVSACTPPAAPAVANVNYTVGDKATALTAMALTGATLKWYESSTATAALPAAPVPSTTAIGKKSYFVSQTLNGCESARAEMVVTVSACTPPAAPTVANVNYTVGDKAAALTATALAGATLKWYESSAATAALPTAPVPSTATAGTKSYFVSQTLNNCESARAEIVVTVSACTPPAAPAVANVSYTVGDKAAALTATGTGLLWYTAATGGIGSSTAPTPSTATVGTTSYYVSQTIGCESARSRIVVTVSACTPPIAPAVANVNYTVGDKAAALTATALAGATLKWYESSTATATLPAAPIPSTTAVGKKSYFVSQTLNNCESARAEIVVTVSACIPPAAPRVTSPVSYSLGDKAVALTATGTGLLWYTTAMGGTGSATAPIPSTTTVGTTSYYVSQTIGCESARAKIDVIVICTPPAAPAITASITTCAGFYLPPLSATGTALKWYAAATGGTGSATAPVPSTTTVGTISYYVSQTIGCESSRAKIDVIIKDTPTAPVVSAPVAYCLGQTTVALTPSGDVYKWYNELTGGTGSSTAPKPAATAVGTTSYYVSQSNTYGTLVCEGPRAKVDITVNPLPAALSTVSEALCQELTDKTFIFPTQPTSGNTINWYTAAMGGSATKTVPSVPLKIAGETTYYATQATAKGCESAERIVQKIRVKPLPPKPALVNGFVEYCQFVAAAPLSATPSANGILNWYGTNAAGGTASETAPTPLTAKGDTTTYYVGQTVEGCVGERSKIEVQIKTTPLPKVKASALAYCQGETASALSAEGNNLKWYLTKEDTNPRNTPLTPFTERVQDYSFFVTQTGTNGCESPKQEIKIHIKALPSATISGNSTIDLGQSATLTLKFTGDGPWKYTLSNGITDSTNLATQPVSVSPKTTTTYSVAAVSNICGKGTPIGTAIVTVKVPTINSGNPNVSEVCAGQSFIVSFQQSGEFPAANKFNVQVSLKNTDSTFYTIPSVVTSNTITATFPDSTAGGDYFVRVVSSGANPDFLIRGSVSGAGITVSPTPVATLSGTRTILTGESADLKVELTGKSPWSFALYNGVRDSLITTASASYSFKVSPAATTTYTISSVSNACGKGRSLGSARIQVDPILGIEPPVTDWVKVYPTVIDGQCTVEIEGAVSAKEARVQVFNMDGRPVFEKIIRSKATDLDFITYPSGLYLLKVQNGNFNSVHRIVKP